MMRIHAAVRLPKGKWGRGLVPAVLLTSILASPPGEVFGQSCCAVQEAYRLVYETAYEQRQVTAYRVDYETVYDQQTVTTQRPQWTTEMQERKYVVQRQLPETAYHDQQYTTWEPTVTCRPVTVDQGQWVNQVVCRPGDVRNRLRWVRGGCVTDPSTGVAAYRPGGLFWVPTQGPSRVEAQRVWMPNPVTVQVPQTAYVQKVATRRIPVTTYRTVNEERVEQVPVQVCQMVSVDQVVSVPRVVEKRTPVTCTYCVPKTVVRRVPVTPSICCSVGYVAPCATCAAPASCSAPTTTTVAPAPASAGGTATGDPAASPPRLPGPLNEEA
jgi:hypothetical protein